MYEFFDHTADLGLRVTAPDLATLFVDAACGLTAMLVDDPTTVRPSQTVTVEIAGTNRESLFFDWLKDLLTRFELEQFLVADCTVVVRDDGLSATLRGEALDRTRHAPSHEVKAITYHGLRVEEHDGAWLAEVIVDI